MGTLCPVCVEGEWDGGGSTYPRRWEWRSRGVGPWSKLAPRRQGQTLMMSLVSCVWPGSFVLASKAGLGPEEVAGDGGGHSDWRDLGT